MKKCVAPVAFSARAGDNARRLRPVVEACMLVALGLGHSSKAQTAGTTPPAATDAGPAPVQNVVVTGIRRGIEDAISIKRDASSIVEAVSAEDIGKLPDNSVAESVSRLSGVTIQRDKITGAATGVSVRGLSPNFNGALLNGREQASTSDARSPEFDLFPSELTGSVLIYKTPDASLVGQGLASTIDLHTLRPLDFDHRVMAVSASREFIGDGSGADIGVGHRATFSYVDQFADRSIGIALGVTAFKEDNGGELKFDDWGGYAPTVDYNGQSVVVPGGFLAETDRRRNDRDGASLTLQYKPSQTFRTSLDVFYSRGHDSTKKTGIEGAIPFGTGPYDPNGALTDAVIVDGVATSGTFSNYKADVRNHLYASSDRLTSIGWNGDLKLDDWRLEADLSHSHGLRRISNFETTAGQPGDTPADQLGSISFSGFDGSNFDQVKYKPSLNYADRSVAVLTDVDGWGGGPATPQAGYVSLPDIDDKVSSARVNLHRDLQWGPVTRAHAGLNLTHRDKSRLGQEGRLAIKDGDGFASVPVPGTGTAIAGPTGIEVVSWDPSGSLGTIYTLNRWVDATVLARDWSVSEKVSTAYAMADLDGELASIPYTGNVGLQFIHTDQSARGNQVDLANCTGITLETCPYVVKTGGAKYNDLLPSLNLAFDLGSGQLLRLGAGMQVTRPKLDDMRASLDFGVQNATAEQPALTGFAGNPALKPYKASSVDLSYEKYFAKKGYLSAALFYKKLNDYIINAPAPFDFAPYTSASTPLPDHGPYKDSTVGFLTTPRNLQGGNLHGIELAINVPLSLLTPVLQGFGATLNYSHTDSSVSLPTAGFVTPNNGPVFKNDVSQIGLPGLSKNVGSVRVYYENDGLQLAWAARYRSSFIGEILDYRSDSQFTFIKEETIIDAQASYEFQAGALKGLSAFVQAHNCTNTPFREYAADPKIITDQVSYGRTYTAGMSYKF